MSQPKITSDQIDVGTGLDQVLTNATLNPVGSGRWVQAIAGPIAPASGTSVIPFDTTTPLITEGTQIGSASITPTNASSQIIIEFSVTLDASANNTPLILTVFRNSTCIHSAVVSIDTTGRPKTHSTLYVDAPATTSSVTYSGRIGVDAAGPTWYVNSVSTGNNLGGTITSSFALEEIA